MSVRINLGAKILDYNSGLKTENIPLEYFKYNILISEGDQTERSALLSHILNQIYERVTNIGVLLIKLNSNENTNLYHLDRVYEYGDPNLEIPYFFGNALSSVHREHFERCINAVFGFHFEMSIVIGCLLLHYKIGKFPSSVIDFLEDLKNYLIKNPYSEDFTESNVRSIEKAINFIQEDPILERTLWMSLDLPKWLRLWSEGKKVCIDLSECSLHYQRILVPLLLQAVKNHTHIKNSNIPIGIVVLEGADNLLKKPPHDEHRKNYAMNRDYYQKIEEENYFLTKEQIEEVFGDNDYLFNVQLENVFNDLIFDELNDRNISLITVCGDSSKIYDHFRDHSQIKINLD